MSVLQVVGDREEEVGETEAKTERQEVGGVDTLLRPPSALSCPAVVYVCDEVNVLTRSKFDEALGVVLSSRGVRVRRGQCLDKVNALTRSKFDEVLDEANALTR
mmetsp:Transcript_13/g.28  ORF Transcript_13/g.28 Transcript_13/m.28 type:complete len:104 (+) Transcript_13:149-460(+)